jgi:hypothetical protein
LSDLCASLSGCPREVSRTRCDVTKEGMSVKDAPDEVEQLHAVLID